MKKAYLLIAAIAVIGGAVFFVNKNKKVEMNNGELQQGTNEIQKTQETGVTASTSTVSQVDSFYDIKADYPQFGNMDQAFNDEIKNLVLGKIDTFKKDAKDNWDARNATLLPGETFFATPTEPFDFIASWTQTQMGDKYISFVINMYYFTGGAHGANEIYAFNYDVKVKKEISINDFLGNNQQAFLKLSQLANQQVTLRLKSSGMQMDSFLMQMIREGTNPTADNYANFNFTDDSLIIYFQQYQVAPGAAGQITITLSKGLLQQSSITSNYLQ
jgi:hypothetical protein